MRLSSVTSIIAAMLLAISCTWDDPVIYRDVTMAEPTADGRLKTDSGVIYNIVKKSCEASLEGKTRVLILCDVLKKTADKQYDIELLQLIEPLKKDPVPSSTLTKPDDGLGNDPVAITQAWISGGYMNLCVAVKILSKEQDHVINLEFDDTAPSDTLRFTLRHDDGVDDSTDAISSDTEIGTAYATFPIRQLLPEGKETIPVKLSWTWDNDYTLKDGFSL